MTVTLNLEKEACDSTLLRVILCFYIAYDDCQKCYHKYYWYLEFNDCITEIERHITQDLYSIPNKEETY